MRLSAATRRKYRSALWELRSECPCAHPVRVRLLPGPSRFFGLSNISRDGGSFNVRLYRRIVEADGRTRAVTRQELLDALVHEWAHVLSWSASHRLEAHDPSWGVAYARCYQATCED